MTIALTTDITFDPGKRVKATVFKKNKDQKFVVVQVKILSSPAAGKMKEFFLRADDGVGAQCQRLRLNPNPVDLTGGDRFLVDYIIVNNAYTQILAADRAGTDDNDSDKRVEAVLLSLGMLGTEFAGTIS